MKPSEYLIKSNILVEKPKNELDINRLKYEQILSDLDSRFISREEVLKMIEELAVSEESSFGYADRQIGFLTALNMLKSKISEVGK